MPAPTARSARATLSEWRLAPHPDPTVPPLLVALGADVRAAVLLVAAGHEDRARAPGAPLDAVLAACAAAGIGPGALAAAEAAGLVERHGGAMRLAPALPYSLVRDRVPYAVRQLAHRRLASALDTARDRLARLTQNALGAEDPRGQAALFVAAAERALIDGLPGRASELTASAQALPADGATLARAAHVRGRVALRDGPVADARETLMVAARLLAPHDPAASLSARLEAAEASWALGDAAAYREAVCSERDGRCADCAGAGRGPVGAGSVAAHQRSGMCAVLRGDADRFAAGAVTLRHVVDAGSDEDDAEELLRAGATALVLGDLAAASRITGRALAQARAHGLPALVPRALELLAYAELRAGRHARARVYAEDGVRCASAGGQRNVLAHQHAVLALVASLDRDGRAVAAHAAVAEAVAGGHGLVQASTLTQWALARADLARGRVVEAAARLAPVVRPGPRQGHFAVRMLAVPCFVESLARTGAPGPARGPLEEFRRRPDFAADPQAPAQLARCEALLSALEGAPEARTEEWYERALAEHQQAGGDFERARTLVLYGTWLRRERHPVRARRYLRDALVAFERCGARVWAQAAGAELRATGATAGTGRPVGALASLTPQQLRIARSVAEGATNREVAHQLSLSVRTVDHHLRNVFATLGVRSRVELSRLVADQAG
ncbi:LuxR C-terminal-related transcriptional regulator [Streptomyces sp. NPDC001941]|uniref:LuxR C-terminal-related transcriptional regulator n=1 Tax=Streptomyces sp. NPDC001941 TaxID=3154659 RepID=UPI00331C817F